MNQRRLAWTIWGVSTAFLIAWLVVDASSTPVDIGQYAFVVFAVLLYSTVGALITSRQSGNRVGLLFAWVGLSASISLLAGSYTTMAQQRDLSFMEASAWLGRVGFLAMFGPLAFLFLIFPTGRPVSRRWGWLLRGMVGAYAVTLIGFALTPGSLKGGFTEPPNTVVNPIGLPLSWKLAVETVTTAAGFLVFVGALISVISLIQRYRRAAQAERQQIRWLAFLGVFLGVAMVLFFALMTIGLVSDEGAVSTVAFFAFITGVFLGIPAVCGIAILRHGLWDLDVVVKKTIVFSILVLLIMVASIGLFVMASGPLTGLAVNDAQTAGVVGGILGFLVWPLYRVSRRIADRLVYRGRSSSYEVLTEFSQRMAVAYSTDDVLPRLAAVLGEGTGATSAVVWLQIGNDLRAEARWPSVADAPSGAPPDAVAVIHQGEPLGALSVELPANDPMNPAKEKIVRDLAGQAGLVLRNVALIEDLRASRQRLVAAQDEERRRIERNIHDGAQQQLVALAVKHRLAASLIGKDDEQLRAMLEQLRSDTDEALEDLRDLARGIYPPLLADQGLAAALGAQARKAPVTVDLETDGIGRYPQETEAAVYFSCLEALQNVAKYAEAATATVRLAQTNGILTFEVSDDGRGFDPGTAERGSGLQGMADRLAALGGDLTVRSAPGEGTTITGSLRVEAAP
jgi:signal transduction histidine kinase